MKWIVYILLVLILFLFGCLTIQTNVNSPGSRETNTREKQETWPDVEVDPQLNIGTGNRDFDTLKTK